MFMSVSRDKFTLLTGVSVSWFPASIQISINLGKTFLRISCLRKITVTWIMTRDFVYLASFFSQILEFIHWTVLIFIEIYFEWRDTENQQLFSSQCYLLFCQILGGGKFQFFG